MSLKNSICSLEQERISCKSGLEAPNNCLLAAIAWQPADYLFSFPSMRTN
jgi:hypothetical protein